MHSSVLLESSHTRPGMEPLFASRCSHTRSRSLLSLLTRPSLASVGLVEDLMNNLLVADELLLLQLPLLLLPVNFLQFATLDMLVMKVFMDGCLNTSSNLSFAL